MAELPPTHFRSATNPAWTAETRRRNQFDQFRQQSAARFRRLETSLYRDFEKKGEAANIDSKFAPMLSLLENVDVRREGSSFTTASRATGITITPSDLSSGESELLTLGIECLVFGFELSADKPNLLLLDEPDVHLHPDLQAKFADFLMGLVEERRFQVILATHSTALLGGLSSSSRARVGFMRPGEASLEFFPIEETMNLVLPVFGAHPLSSVFNDSPVLLVEGEDDERIWQQAVRSSKSAMKLYPVSCGSKSEMGRFEAMVGRIAPAVYDSPKAFSLRDGDGIHEHLVNQDPVIRLRLACRAAENLLLTDEVLEFAGIDWPTAKARIQVWIDANADHKYWQNMRTFAEEGFDRAQFDLKEVRMILVGSILESTKPWEVLVGQTLGALACGSARRLEGDGSVADFLGAKTQQHLLSSEPTTTPNA